MGRGTVIKQQRTVRSPRDRRLLWQVAGGMCQACGDPLGDNQWVAALEEADQHRIYERIPPEKPYGTMDALLLAEIGETATSSTARVMARAEDTLPLPFHGEVGNGRSRVDNINSTPKGGGTNADYLTSRIARDRPDILERMQAGEYKSVRAAADDAGIVKRRVSIPLDAERAASLIRKHFTAGQVVALIEALSSPEDMQCVSKGAAS